MPIDFPNNPSTGQTYSYAGQKWQYNGIAWDKLIIADDANALYGISGSIYASSLTTGLLYGGILSINTGSSAHFDITAGKGQIHTSGSTYTADPQPTLQYVTWPAQTGITLSYLATNDTTWIYIDGTGTVQQRTEYYTDTQLEETIIIGQLVHPSRTFINLARTNPNVAYATDKQYEQFIRSFGPIKISGHTIQPNGANLKLNRTSGSAFSLGRNWINDTDNPSVVSDGAYNDCIFYRYYRGATAGTFITVPNQTVIDPTKYDDGTGTLATVPGGKYTIQRLFYYPNTPTLLGVYYGRAEYTSLADAAANINFENFTEIENTRTNAIFVGYLLIKSGCTDITNTSDALILQAGNFRSTTSGGGSVSLTLDDLTDVIITSPQNYQVLTYVDGVTGWENHSVSSLPLVSSIRGLTGAVGITNGSGIGLSVSGQTMTFSNTGVLSIDGGTGAITNVARTNVTNLFSESQIISAPGAYLQIYDSSSFNEVAFQGDFNRLYFYNDLSGGDVYLQPTFTPASTITVSLPNYTTTLAGLAGTQTFTGTNTFNALTNFPGGISAAGATFSSLVGFNAGISAAGGTFGGNIRLQNAEFIQNTTNGRIDFMPAPIGSTHYGLYVDTTSWGFGPRLGTIRSSDNALNTAFILWDAPLVVGNDVNFSLGSNQQNLFRLSTTGNDTVQFSTNVTTGTNSGALALVDSVGLGTANRSPGVTHSNPNLYVYRAGSASANDFIRIEHNGTNGRIVSGGTSGISIEPGSGIVGVSGGISASSGMTLTGTFNLNGQTFNNVVSAINGITGGITFAAGSGITLSTLGNTITIGNGYNITSGTAAPTGGVSGDIYIQYT